MGESKVAESLLVNLVTRQRSTPDVPLVARNVFEDIDPSVPLKTYATRHLSLSKIPQPLINSTTIGSTLTGNMFHRQGLPTDETTFVPQSSYFQRHGALPSPPDVRSRYTADGGYDYGELVTRVAKFPELGLIVKFGSKVTIAEGQTLLVLNTFLKGKVPAPELFGWIKDGCEVFVYMQLIPGPALGDVWPTMTPDQKSRVCSELRLVFTNLHSLKQDPSDQFVGSVSGGPVTDHIFSHVLQPNGFPNVETFHDWYAGTIYQNHPEPVLNPIRHLFLDNISIVLTHADLHRWNVIVSPIDPTKVWGLIDWGQAGWLPAYWDLYKARFLTQGREGEDWGPDYLERVLGNQYGAVWTPWLYFAHQLGF